MGTEQTAGLTPYRALTRPELKAVVRLVSEGYSGRWGRRAAYLHRDAVKRRLRPRRGVRLIAVTSGGAIPEIADTGQMAEYLAAARAALVVIPTERRLVIERFFDERA